MQTRKPSAPSTTDYFGPFIVYLEEKKDEPLVLYYRTQDGASDSELTDLRYFPYQAGEEVPVFEAFGYTEVLNGGEGWPQFSIYKGCYIFSSPEVIENNQINIIKRIEQQFSSLTKNTNSAGVKNNANYTSALGSIAFLLNFPVGDCYEDKVLPILLLSPHAIGRVDKIIEMILNEAGPSQEEGEKELLQFGNTYFSNDELKMLSFFEKIKFKLGYHDQYIPGAINNTLGFDLELLKRSSNVEQQKAMGCIEAELREDRRKHVFKSDNGASLKEITEKERKRAEDERRAIKELEATLKFIYYPVDKRLTQLKIVVLESITMYNGLLYGILQLLHAAPLSECDGLRTRILKAQKSVKETQDAALESITSPEDQRILLRKFGEIEEKCVILLSRVAEKNDFSSSLSLSPRSSDVLPRSSLDAEEIASLSEEILELSDQLEKAWPGVRRGLEERFQGEKAIQASDYEKFIQKEYKPFDKWDGIQESISAIGADKFSEDLQETITRLNEKVNAGVQFLDGLGSRWAVELPAEADLKEDVEAALPAPQVAHVEQPPKARVMTAGAGTMFAVEPSALTLSGGDRASYTGELAVFIDHYSSSRTYFAQSVFNSHKKTSKGKLECVAKAEVAKGLMLALKENKGADEIRKCFTMLLRVNDLKQDTFFNGENKEKQLSEPLKKLLSSRPPAPAAEYK